ncbi:MAG TPA: T9SS type A sorting domain-containing protein, partial [Bacteroidota bacterium]|nr:T9SS type A sorting domain-containing protein [Bacteroidota bacterium]
GSFQISGTPQELNEGDTTMVFAVTDLAGESDTAKIALHVGDYTVSVSESWNMISLPVITPSTRVADIFPTAITRAFRFSKGYVPLDTMKAGIGYWLKFPGAQSVVLNGVSLETDTIALAQGWNMIGSVDLTVDTSQLVFNPPANLVSNIYAYQSGYVAVGAIEPGRAYWVKAAQSGALIENPSHLLVPAHARAFSDSYLEKTNLLTFDDGTSKQNLYFGSGSPPVAPERYELPPPPPEGSLDVRYLAQTNLATLADRAGQNEAPLKILSGRKSVTLSWTIRELNNAQYAIVQREQHGGESKDVRVIRLSANSGKLTLDASGTTSYALVLEPKPTAYKLYQNFPNPFNPATTITFDLPEQTPVTLKIFDVLGKEIVSLYTNQLLDAGSYTASFDGSGFASGLYFYRLQAGRYTSTKKLMLMK